MKDLVASLALGGALALAYWRLRRKPLGIVNETGLRWGFAAGAALMAVMAVAATLRVIF